MGWRSTWLLPEVAACYTLGHSRLQISQCQGNGWRRALLVFQRSLSFSAAQMLLDSLGKNTSCMTLLSRIINKQSISHQLSISSFSGRKRFPGMMGKGSNGRRPSHFWTYMNRSKYSTNRTSAWPLLLSGYITQEGISCSD
jgi:hypothetical protein